MELNKQLTNEYLSQIKSLHLKSQLILEGTMTGGHSSPFHGYSSEFSQYKSYTPGDDLKFFDWKAYGRTERPVIRQYQDETNVNVYLVLDNSASMNYLGGGEINKFEYAIVLTATLALMAYNQRDAISLVYGADSPQGLTRPRNSPANLKQIFHTLEHLKSEGVTDLKGLFNQLAPHLKSRSMTFLVTDLWQDTQDIIAGIKSIRHKSQAITLIHLLTPWETLFFEGRDIELTDLENLTKLKISATHLKKEYLETLQAHQNYLRSECFLLKAKYVGLQTTLPFYQSMRQVLSTDRF
jgi:uncharacterized protein (DUF58 family)